MLGVVGSFGLAAGLVWSSPTLVLMPVPVASFVLLLRRRSRSRAERTEKAAALSAFVDSVGIELRSGASLHGAITNAMSGPQVAALQQEFDVVRSAVEAGSTLDVALASLGRSSSIDELSLLGTTAAVLAEHGGPVGPAIDRLSELIRSGQANDRAIRSQASQATASASVMAGLPVAFGSVLALIDGRLAVFYLRSPLGTACVAGCFGLVAFRWVWMDHLIWSDR